MPLALEFAKKKEVVGFDINSSRIKKLNSGLDENLEINRKSFLSSKKLKFTSNKKDLELANCFIVTVPTPVDKNNKPDLRQLLSACKMLGKIIKRGDVIICESTVYPGCTEEKCVPIIEKFSRLKLNKDFCGYSPERINPGDKIHTITNVKKLYLVLHQKLLC